MQLRLIAQERAPYNYGGPYDYNGITRNLAYEYVDAVKGGELHCNHFEILDKFPLDVVFYIYPTDDMAVGIGPGVVNVYDIVRY